MACSPRQVASAVYAAMVGDGENLSGGGHRSLRPSVFAIGFGHARLVRMQRMTKIVRMLRLVKLTQLTERLNLDTYIQRYKALVLRVEAEIARWWRCSTPSLASFGRFTSWFSSLNPFTPAM